VNDLLRTLKFGEVKHGDAPKRWQFAPSP
jgi:hypothetical protein